MSLGSYKQSEPLLTIEVEFVKVFTLAAVKTVDLLNAQNETWVGIESSKNS